ncbi:hypothetical protein [uncultured Mucilaginibacter sp.]|uniref:hypothetical protein n=1 Tax=uncultured Mucilaginibacter sp. TaxID=797541 RepID=UPI0025E152EE|nr:hypothetical protein [uncultured Mucilaginibacter sp.]
MASSTQNKIGKRPEKEPVPLMDTLHDTWRVMKPFVYFSVKALKVMAHALIFIVKHIPKPEEHPPESKKDKVIKI